MKILEWSTWQKQIRPLPPTQCAAYWQSGDTEACAKKLSQILAGNIDHGGGGLVSEFMSGILAT